MTIVTNDNGMQVLDPPPTGEGGQLIQGNFEELGARAGNIYVGNNSPLSGDDIANTNANGKFTRGSLWYDTGTGATYLCTDPTAGAAVWQSLIQQIPAPSIIRNHGHRILLTHDFASAAIFANQDAGGDGEIVDDTTHFRCGVQSVKMGIPVGEVRSRTYKYDLWGADGAGVDLHDGAVAWIRYWLPESPYTPSKVTLLIHSDANRYNYQLLNVYDGVSAVNATPGWHVVKIYYDPDYAGQNFDGTDITGLSVWVYDENGKYIVVDRVMFLKHLDHKPTFLWRFDDCNDDCMTMCAILEKYGWFAILGCNPSKVGAAGKCTLAQLKELQARGHLIVNHTWSHQFWGDITLEECKQEFFRAKYWLINNGFVNGADVFIFPHSFAAPTGQAQDVTDFLLANTRVIHARNFRSLEATQRTNGANYNEPYTPCDPRIFWDVEGDGDLTPDYINNTSMLMHGPQSLLVHHLDATGLTTAEFLAIVDLIREKEVAGTAYVNSLDEYLAKIATI